MDNHQITKSLATLGKRSSPNGLQPLYEKGEMICSSPPYPPLASLKTERGSRRRVNNMGDGTASRCGSAGKRGRAARPSKAATARASWVPFGQALSPFFSPLPRISGGREGVHNTTSGAKRPATFSFFLIFPP